LIEQFEEIHSPYLPMYSQLNFDSSFPFERTITLVSLLSGARNEQKASLSQKIVDRMKHFFPEMKAGLTAAIVLLANTYASTGQFHQASTVRMEIAKSGWKKKVGVSTTVVNGQLTVGDD
jgi:TRAP-type mannitol/chloroaromatic compound transport system permease large subunit